MKQVNFDNKLLEEVGLKDLPGDDKVALLKYVREVMEIRLGERLSTGLSSAVLEEFYQHIQNKQPDKAYAWIKQNAPNYEQIIEIEMSRIKRDLRASAPQILATANSPSLESR